MQERSNPIFQLDWEYDLQHVQEPAAYLPSDNYKKYPLIQADPTDKLCFSKEILGKSEHRSNKMIWMSTLDRYLRQYYLLARQREKNECNHILLQKIKVPHQVHEEYLDYLTRRNKYPICYDIKLFEQVIGETPKDIEFVFYNIPRFAGGSYLNYICHSIYTRKNADDDRYSLFADGLKFRLHGIGDFIPPFELLDYFEHEMTTGLSLSIEIASVMLEFKDDGLRNWAWNAFCEKVLPRIIHSQLFFTRNTVARHFFQQILMEEKRNDYRWYPETTRSYTNEVLNRALSHTELIWSEYELLDCKSRDRKKKRGLLRGNIYPNQIRVPTEQIDDALKHLWSLLSIVTQPFNLCYYGENITNNISTNKYLAAFCNPQHKHVEKYLDDLNKCENYWDSMENIEKGEKYPMPRKRDKAHSVFRMVHSVVRKMI